MGNVNCGCNELDKMGNSNNELATEALRMPTKMEHVVTEINEDEVIKVEAREEDDGTIYSGQMKKEKDGDELIKHGFGT